MELGDVICVPRHNYSFYRFRYLTDCGNNMDLSDYIYGYPDELKDQRVAAALKMLEIAYEGPSELRIRHSHTSRNPRARNVWP